ncbi:MAG: NAD-dependent epimerase/dehydratase family protein [Deltaproteobacteria bacterium]|nr:NAD-dependent epimerase/dehydratase family protein [Deltaproteobacteria bacterium]
MRIFITGAAGFIASHIQDAFLDLGHEVAVLDNLISGKRENINPKSKFYELDIVNPEVEAVFQEFKPEVLCHHAAQMEVRRSVAEPAYDAKINILGTLNLLEAGRKVGLKKVIFASSGGAIYGEQDFFPATEKHPLRPASPYGLSKMVGEEYLRLYERLYQIKSVSLRYGNVYGPRQNPHGEAGVVAIFLEKMLKGENPVINGDGLQTRDYVYVADVVKANVLALKNEVNGVFNIGTNCETSVIQLFEILSSFSQVKRAEHAPAKLGEQRRSLLSFEQAKSEISWLPQVSISEGLRLTFEWFKNCKKS